MERALTQSLSKQLEDQKEFLANKNTVVREAEMIALISTAIRQKGAEDTDDDDYAEHARQLSVVARKLADSARTDDLPGARAAVEKITNACSHCHEAYR